MTSSDIIPELKQLCRRVAPELANVPLYIVCMSDLGPRAELFIGNTAMGCTISCLDLTLRPFIPDWRGRGACMLLDDGILDEQAWSIQAPDFSEHDAFTFVYGSVALHELAHILQRGYPYYAPYLGVDSPPPLETIAQALTMSDDDLPGIPRPPWTGHECDWLRVVLHLSCRARRLGLDIRARAVAAGNYGLSCPFAYVAALGDEPALMIDQPFSEILTLPMPEPFARLWENDTRKRRNVEDTMQYLNRLIGMLGERKEERARGFDELVHDLANGADVDPSQAEIILAESGRSANDLENAVRKILERRKLRERMADGTAAEQELLSVRRRIDAANQEFELARQKHAHAMASLSVEEQALLQRLTASSAAVHALRQTADDELRQEHAKLSLARDLSGRQRSEARKQADQIRVQIEVAKDPRHRAEANGAGVETLERRKQRAEQRARELAEQENDLGQRIGELAAAMLQA